MDGVTSNIGSLTVNTAPVTPSSTEATIEYYTEGGKNSDKHLYANITFNPIVVGASVIYTLYLDDANGDPVRFDNPITVTIGDSGTLGFTVKNAPSGHYTSTVESSDGSLDMTTSDGNDPENNPGFTK